MTVTAANITFKNGRAANTLTNPQVINLITPNSLFGARFNQLDLVGEQVASTSGWGRLRLAFDLYNALNGNSIQNVTTDLRRRNRGCGRRRSSIRVWRASPQAFRSEVQRASVLCGDSMNRLLVFTLSLPWERVRWRLPGKVSCNRRRASSRTPRRTAWRRPVQSLEPARARPRSPRNNQAAVGEPASQLRSLRCHGQEQPMLSKSGMKKSKKTMIYLAAGVGLAATAWTIDHTSWT